MSTDLLPVGLPVAGRATVVVGGGMGAAAAVHALLAAGARVSVVAPAPLTAALDDLAERGLVEWRPRDWAATDLDGCWLVLARSGSEAIDARVRADADAARVWSVEEVAGVEDADDFAPGTVMIVGGGPGDPGLITARGRAVLRRAEVVVADRLAPLALLAELAPAAELIDAAKVPGGRSMPQEEINAQLVAHARAGRRVVRLKGGDPFVFGRGMEEVEACAAAGVAVEVVPGVTSAISVPALAGIPVTHRGLTQSFTVVSGHVPPGSPESTVDWAALARSGGTLVLLMAVRTLPAIVAALLQAGLDPDTPAATVENGASAQQRVVWSTLAALPADAADVRPPAVTVIGAVAARPPLG